MEDTQGKGRGKRVKKSIRKKEKKGWKGTREGKGRSYEGR